VRNRDRRERKAFVGRSHRRGTRPTGAPFGGA
jgi:hypothetical protein